jgi:hypothetical protein
MLDELVSHEITLEGVNKAMDDMSSGEVTRSVIVFGSTSEPTQREAAQPDLA